MARVSRSRNWGGIALCCTSSSSARGSLLLASLRPRASPTRLMLNAAGRASSNAHLNRGIPDVSHQGCFFSPALVKTTSQSLFLAAGGNQDGKFSVGFRDGVVRTVVSLDRETVASYALILEAIGEGFSLSLRPLKRPCLVSAPHSPCTLSCPGPTMILEDSHFTPWPWGFPFPVYPQYRSIAPLMPSHASAQCLPARPRPPGMGRGPGTRGILATVPRAL